MKYILNRHIDSMIQVTVEANSEKEAFEKAEEKFDRVPETQILQNAQSGETWIQDVIRR